MQPRLSLEAEIIQEVVWFPAASLKLKGELAYPESVAPRGGVVIAGPHPLLGGDLENNVVRGVAGGLACREVATLSFNYRGVGGSDGEVPDVAGRLAAFWATSHVPDEGAYAEDLRAAVEGLHDMLGSDLPLGLVGYSFGCSLLPTLALRPDVPLVLIAPTLGNHDYAAFADLPNPLLVVAPEGDFATDADQLMTWFDALTSPKCLMRGKWDDHFFRGMEDQLATWVFDFLDVSWEVHACR